MTTGTWEPPMEYPYYDTDDSSGVERYDCRCGKFYWLSGPNGAFPLTRYRQ